MKGFIYLSYAVIYVILVIQLMQKIEAKNHWALGVILFVYLGLIYDNLVLSCNFFSKRKILNYPRYFLHSGATPFLYPGKLEILIHQLKSVVVMKILAFVVGVPFMENMGWVVGIGFSIYGMFEFLHLNLEQVEDGTCSVDYSCER
jgi:hypothetical protein